MAENNHQDNVSPVCLVHSTIVYSLSNTNNDNVPFYIRLPLHTIWHILFGTDWMTWKTYFGSAFTCIHYQIQWLTEMSTPLEKIYIYFCLMLARTVNYSLNALTVSFGSLRNMTGVFFSYGCFSYTNSDTI